jgi:dihydrofolate reductase
LLTAAGAASNREDYSYKAFFDSADALVMGRNTYETALGFDEWQYGDKGVIVLSRGTLRMPDHLAAIVEIMASSPAECVSRLAERGVTHGYVDGGQTIQRFLNAGLIDEVTITRLPILIGEGVPLFGRLDADIQLEHIETRSYASGYVQSKYRPLKGDVYAEVT